MENVENKFINTIEQIESKIKDWTSITMLDYKPKTVLDLTTDLAFYDESRYRTIKVENTYEGFNTVEKLLIALASKFVKNKQELINDALNILNSEYEDVREEIKYSSLPVKRRVAGTNSYRVTNEINPRLKDKMSALAMAASKDPSEKNKLKLAVMQFKTNCKITEVLEGRKVLALVRVKPMEDIDVKHNIIPLVSSNPYDTIPGKLRQQLSKLKYGDLLKTVNVNNDKYRFELIEGFEPQYVELSIADFALVRDNKILVPSFTLLDE